MDSAAYSSLTRGPFSSIGDSSEMEANLPLSDRLKGFKTSKFDIDSYVTSKCQAMTEKEIKHLCSYLIELKKASAEEMRKSVYANYGAFIRFGSSFNPCSTSREISDLEGELLLLRNHLSTQAALIHGLTEGNSIESLSGDIEVSTVDNSSNESSQLPNKDEWLVEFLDSLEVLLVEKRMDEALAALDEGERIAEDTTRRRSLSAAALTTLHTAIRNQRHKLACLLEQTISQPSTRGVELRSAAQALKKLGDGSRAHMLLLNSHQQKLQRSLQSFRASGNSGGGIYTAAISQFVFSTISQAASDSLGVFGEEPAYASELVTWSVRQTDSFAMFLKRYVIASSAAVGSMRIAAECVHICMGHCSLLEARGLALTPVLFRHFRPFIENAITANLRRIEQTSAALAASDDWLLAYSPLSSRFFPGSSSTSSLSSVVSQPKLSRSAHRFNTMVQEFVEDMGSLESLQLDSLTLEGVLQVFNSYINLLITALSSSVENEMNLEGSATKIVRLAETEPQQIALLANASLLADELLPRAASKIFPQNRSETPRKTSSRLPEQREWKRRLQRSVDRLRDSFCRQHALELIFTEDGDTRLNAQVYLSMDGNGNAEEPEWFPSQIFQALFAKLTLIAGIATEMFVGRERFATVLLMRLTETVILWLSEDQAFWEEIEVGPRPLGPFGLQQLYLDMEFVILFASQGRYLSRNLHQVIKNIIARAIESLAATGTDPYSALPEDDWFAEVAQIAIKMLTGKGSFGNIDRDVTSPTASVSAKSISSVHSHGSN
ncbi:exocyst complex component EXO84A [Cucurbita moschata]|uniref:Exocyst complex component EXO84A n=1 Tax=Cucurbita moschata TaxID=3662 RepID=A0A6J1G527_CUCMO|nr:exocyst complex component EXO84A [Cucurbita moschata]